MRRSGGHGSSAARGVPRRSMCQWRLCSPSPLRYACRSFSIMSAGTRSPRPSVDLFSAGGLAMRVGTPGPQRGIAPSPRSADGSMPNEFTVRPNRLHFSSSNCNVPPCCGWQRWRCTVQPAGFNAFDQCKPTTISNNGSIRIFQSFTIVDPPVESRPVRHEDSSVLVYENGEWESESAAHTHTPAL